MLAAAALSIALGLPGCAPPAAEPRLKGHRPAIAVGVGDVSLPEVRPGEPDRPFAFRARPGGLLYVFFGFAQCPDVCPETLSNLRRALERLGEDARRVEVAFVTVDLARDSAEVLVPYLESFVRGGHALRARSQAQLGRAEAAFGATSSVVRRPDGGLQVTHTPLAYAVDERGRLLVRWDFGTPPADLAHDLRWLLRAAGDREP